MTDSDKHGAFVEEFEAARARFTDEAFRLCGQLSNPFRSSLIPYSEATRQAIHAHVEAGDSHNQAIAKALWETVIKDMAAEFPRVYLVHGAVTTMLHSWFALELPPEEAHDPKWKIIVDPCCPDVQPSVLVIGPNSPLRLAYIEMSREGRGA